VGFVEDQGPADPVFWVNRFVDAFFVVDMIFNFFFAFQDRTGRWVVNHGQIVRHYLKSFFPVDLVSILPFDLVGVVLSSDTLRSMKIFRVLRLLRLLKLIRILRASRIVKRWKASVSLSLRAIGVGNFLVVLFVLTHWIACAFALCAQLESPSWKEVFVARHVMTHDSAVTAIELRVHEAKVSHFTLYMAAAHWAGMTLTSIGYGDIGAVSTTERGVGIVLMLVAGCLWAYLIGHICSLCANKEEEDFHMTMDSLNSCLAEYGVGLQLQRRCRDYVRERRGGTAAAFRTLREWLSPALRAEVANATSRIWVDKVPYFRGTCSEFVVELQQATVSEFFAQREVFGMPWSLYAVLRGSAVCRARVLRPGSVWGAEDMLLHSWKLLEYSSAVCLTHVEVNVLSRKVLEALLEKYPEERAMVRKAYVRATCRAAVLLEARKRLGRAKPPSRVAAFLAWTEMQHMSSTAGVKSHVVTTSGAGSANTPSTSRRRSSAATPSSRPVGRDAPSRRFLGEAGLRVKLAAIDQDLGQIEQMLRFSARSGLALAW